MTWLRGMGLAVMAVACVEMGPLPATDDLSGDFSVGDTTYLPLSPVWDNAVGLEAPVEIAISHARQVFVADSAHHRIFVFNFAGERLDDSEPLFETLDLARIETGFVPVDIDIDGRLNLLIINEGDKVYRWNQFWNLHGIDSVATAIRVRSTETAVEMLVPADSPLLGQFLNSAEWDVPSTGHTFVSDAAVADSLLHPHVFFDLNDPIDDAADLYYRSDLTRFTAISRARLDDDYFYVADAQQNRLVKVRLVRNGMIKLGNGQTLFTHIGRFEENSLEAGTGAGTMNNPSGLDVDALGNIYYSQLGEYVYVHSVAPIPALSYPSNFELLEHEIMNSDWYAQPNDVAVDQNQLIYIANTHAKEVLVFNGDGEFFKKAGITTMIVDTSWAVISGGDTTLVDTFIVQEIKDQLELPVALAVDERGVIYVCDPVQSSVFRYTLSTRLDENLINVDQ